MGLTVAEYEIPTWVILSGISAILAYYYATRTYHVFKRAGIPGPKPLPLFGNFLTMGRANTLMEYDYGLFKKYGNFVGTFSGSLPVLMVFDPDWLKEAFIKTFPKTMNRRPIPAGPLFDQGLFSIEGEHWKYVRTVLSPTFTQGKLKQMIPMITNCEEEFMRILEDSEGEPVEIRTKLNALTMDVIACTAFGIKVDTQTNPDSVFKKNSLMVLDASENAEGFIAKLKLYLGLAVLVLGSRKFAYFCQKYLSISLLPSSVMSYFENLMDAVLADQSPENKHNFIKSLADRIVEAKPGEEGTLIDSFGVPWTRKGLTREEVLANAVQFLFAGFQTTADSMLFAFFELAWHPDIQQKVYEEIEKVCGEDNEITMEHVNQLHCVEWCINEAMRLYPQGFRFDRMASEDFEVRGIQVKKGTAITTSGYVLHRHPQFWTDPEKFDPERFSPERMPSGTPNAFVPFGIGNRSCIGNRLAMLEMKLTLMNALKKFRFETCDKTPPRPCELRGLLSVCPKDPIYINFVKR